MIEETHRVTCDICKRVLDREKDCRYYDINDRDMPGWARIRYDWDKISGDYQICEDCFKPTLKILKK